MTPENLIVPPGLGHNGGPPLYDPAETFFTDAQVEQRWNVAPGYMSELRAQGTGPPHVRLSPRIIRYRLGTILAYEREKSFGSNAAALEAAKSEVLVETRVNETPAPKPAVCRSRKSPDRKSLRQKTSSQALEAV
jgi:hypothetical protein